MMFVYLGLESATVPAGDVSDAKRTVPRSTILGISIAALLYVRGTVAIMGILPRDQLAKSVAPFSDAARLLWGPWGRDRDLRCRDPLVDRRAERLDAAHGAGSDGGGERWLVPAGLWSSLADRGAGDRFGSFGRVGDRAGSGTGGWFVGFPGIL